MSNPRGNHSSFSPYHSNLTNQLFYPSLPSGFSPQAGSSSSHAPVSASSLCTRHRYTLRSTKENARPWLSLILTSRSPRPEFLPLFVGKDVVSGVVELDLSKPDTIREVKIMKLKGETTHLAQGSNTFIELSQTLATPSGKLSGRISYPFNFVLPDDLTIHESNWAMVYPVPPKFQEKGIMYIDYRIVVIVRRGMFSIDHLLPTDFCYLPETTAERPSVLREQAYMNPTPSDLPSPTVDPGGWKLLPSVDMELVPNTTMTLQLSIANPLSFALGTPIPLFLEVCNEGMSFHPDSIDIRLVRMLTTRGLSGGVREYEVARAVLWPARGSSVQSTKLWGEILVGKFLTPSFDFSNCSVRYSIVLYPRRLPDKSEREALLSEEVLLTLHNAAGIIPRSLAPPTVAPQPVESGRSATTRSFFA